MAPCLPIPALTMKLLFVISHLHFGGAARVISVLASGLSYLDKYKVAILSHTNGTSFHLSSLVGHDYLYHTSEIKRSLFNRVLRHLVYIPKLFIALNRHNPDVVIVSLRGMNWRLILLCRALAIRVIATEHTNHKAETGLFSWIERRLVYTLADDVVVLSDFDYKFYNSFLSSVHIIPNPLPFTPISNREDRQYRILLAGDLDRWYIKGFDLILSVYSSLISEFPEWRLAIAGGGSNGLAYLTNLASKLSITDRVDFLGHSNRVDLEMQASEIFIMSSRYEGFSMVLIEAMSQGCACISFDCIAGPSEILEGGSCGLLVPNGDLLSMTNSLRLLMHSPLLRRTLSTKAIQRSFHFSTDRIVKQWDHLLHSSA